MSNNFEFFIDVVKSIIFTILFIGFILVFSFICCIVTSNIFKGIDMPSYYVVKEDYYCNFKPSGEAEDTWYKYDSKEDNWFQIEDDDLPYQLAITDLKNDHWYSNTWSGGCPFSDFRESESFEEYLDSKVA